MKVVRCLVLLLILLIALDEANAASDEEGPYNADGEQHGDDTCDSHNGMIWGVIR